MLFHIVIKGDKMKLLNNKKKIIAISNIALCLIFCFVLVVSLYPKDSIVASSGKNITAINQGNENENNISIMINVYENTPVVEKMIDVFLEKGALATFFVGGCWADDNEKTLQRMATNNFEIGNHGYFHKDHKKLSLEGNKQEISNCNKIVKELCGYSTNLFAPPSGSFDTTTLLCANDLEHKVIMWSKDTIDWRDKDTSIIFKRATKNLKNGDLVLMHPKEHTLKVLPSIIDYYKNQGYNIVTVAKNIQGKE